MPDPLPGLLSALRNAVPDLDGTALAEALWLAAHMAGDRAATTARSAPPPAPSTADRAEPPSLPDTPPRPQEPAPSPVPRPPGPDGRPAPDLRTLHERLPGSGSHVRGHAVGAPRAAGLPHALELTRALRPWKRRWPRGRHAELDIDATVDGYARSGELIPVLAAAPERWFDLALVVDRSPGMRVWRETIAEFTAVLDRLGAFRTLQVTDLAFDDSGEPLVPGQLRSSDGRRLVVVVSDCMADAWRRPEVWHLLREWAGATPTAVLNPLPTRLWRRGGLNLPTARFTPAAPGTHRSRVPVEPPPLLGPPGPRDPDGPDNAGAPDGDWLPIPVLSLTPHSLGRWSHTLMRGAPEGCTAVLVPPTGRTPGPARPPALPLPPGTLARNLLRTASPRAARLAVLCSPFERLSLRLIHVLREQLVPEAGVADVAELVTSGLFELEENATGGIELVLPADARTVLGAELPAHELWAVHQELDRYVATRDAGPGRLPSVAHDGDGPHDWAAEKEAFARASRRTLELLGFAEPSRPDGPDPSDPSDPSAAVEPDAFVGHTELVARVVRELAEGDDLVYVTARDGVPGAGRTAFARHVADRVRAHFPDGVVFVPLRGSTPYPLPPEAALYQVLRELGVAEEEIPDEHPPLLFATLEQELRRRLAGKRVLLVLDDLGGRQDMYRFATTPPPGCASLITGREKPRSWRAEDTVELPPLRGEDAVRLLAARMGPDATPDAAREAVGSGTWWPLSLRVLGGALLLDADPSSTTSSLPGRRRSTEQALDPAVLVRHVLDMDRWRGSLAGALERLAVVSSGEFTLQEAVAVLESDTAGSARLLDTLVRAGLLERTGPERYAFPNAVHAEVEKGTPFEPRRVVARERVARFHRAAAAALREERHPGSALPALLGVTPEPAPHPEVWIPNALAPSGLGPPGLEADTLFLLHGTGATPLYRARFAQAARSLIDGRSLYADEAWVRAVVALAHAQQASGRAREAWDTVHKASTFQLQGDAATYGPTALLFARLSLDGQPDDTQAALSWAEEAVAYLDSGPTARSPETTDALRCLEQALAASGDYEELRSVQKRLGLHLAARELHHEEGQVLLRLCDTLLFLDRRAEAEAPARRALALLEAAGDAAGRETAERLLRTAREASDKRTLVVLEGPGRASRLEAETTAVLFRAGLVDQFESHLVEEGVLLVVDALVPVHELLRDLVERLPRRLDGGGDGGPLRLAVHSGPLRLGSDVPLLGLGVEYTRQLLRSAEFRRVSDNYPDDTTLCVSPEAFAALRDTDVVRRFTAQEVRTQDGTEVCVILTPLLDLSAYDSELIALARVFNELDPDGRRFAGILRDCVDGALDPRNTGRFDPAELEPDERARIRGEVRSGLQNVFPFVRGRTFGLVWQRPQGEVPFDLKFSLDRPRQTFGRTAVGTVALIVYADDARARWSAGLVRVRPEHLTPGADRDGLSALTAEAHRSAVLWLHRDAPLPENVLLRLDPETRDHILSRPDDVSRVIELFRRIRFRTLPASALRPLIRDTDPARTVRLAGAALREDGLLLLTGNPRGRETAGTLRLPVPEPDEYVCAPLTRRRSEHGARPSVVADGAAWVVAGEGDELAPLPAGFPALRNR
ncbi:NaeI family type II restriction endonuclease [Streptomyces sp. NPDC046385]|uniref:NaeI family type II restriction endonuclease n=1 Tax=Streptomyces sp. NPDC046385 TaxID=3154918 RepID=UPI00340CE71D